MGEKWHDELEATRVSSIDSLEKELANRTRRDQAYLIVLAGNEVGKMFKLDDGENFRRVVQGEDIGTLVGSEVE